MGIRKSRAVTCVSLLTIWAVVFSGCASKMALDKKSGVAPGEDKPIGIFTLSTENQYKPSFKPRVEFMRFVSDGTGKSTKFEAGKPREEPGRVFNYLISIDLEPGGYLFKDLWGEAGDPFMQATFKFPVKKRFTFPGQGVVYLGHVEMINRKRNKGEERSGSVIPLVDQWVSGFGGGTFDISVTDRGDEDIQAFIRKYPSLNGIAIGKAIMQ